MSTLFPHDYLVITTSQYPNKIAVTDDKTRLTYIELARLSDHLAQFLRSSGVTRGDHVVYFMKRSCACLIATIGILNSGAAYVPIDPKTPLERWQYMIEDAAPKAIICDVTTLSETINRIRNIHFNTTILCIGTRQDCHNSEFKTLYVDEVEANGYPTGIPIEEGWLDDVAYILYTSGSTGVPKGVMVTHGNIMNYIDWAVEYFSVTAEDCILGTAPFHFDMSTFDIFTSLATGASLCLADEQHLLFPESLVRFIEQEHVTLWKGVSSLLMYICRSGVLKSGRMPSLNKVIFAGEPLDVQYLNQWMEIFPNISYFNGYGPTEATGISLCYRVMQVPKPGNPIPIGHPCKGAKVAVIGEDGFPVHQGEIGELCIAGDCIAKGYLNDQEKTNRHFTPSPPGCELGERIFWTGDLVRQSSSGDFIFVSRKDYQVKWMGYRIEPGEIEMAIMTHPQVRAASVLLMSLCEENLKELVAFLEVDGELELAGFTNFLENKLPPYMIPKQYIALESLPRNDRGKIVRDDLLRLYNH